MATPRKKSAAPSRTPRKPKTSAPKAAAPKPAHAATAAHQPLDLEDIKALIALAGREPFQEFEFEAGDMRFRIRKDGPAPVIQAAAAAPMVMAAPAPVMQMAMPAPAAQPVPVEDPSIHFVTSPIVGTFYRAPNPTASPFVSPGDFVKPGQTLCIIEAMKLMNEIESELAGEVVKVLVENGQPVEYGERLFAVRIG
jgi:acetyl-CoA carboxylase biotin carboxyl carrier protein